MFAHIRHWDTGKRCSLSLEHLKKESKSFLILVERVCEENSNGISPGFPNRDGKYGK